MGYLTRAWLDWPSPCHLCGAAVGQWAGLCEACRLVLPIRHTSVSMALSGICRVIVPFWYEYPLIPLIRDFKFHGAIYLSSVLAEGWTPLLSASGGIDVLLPIPLSHRRWRERGYNQARELAWPLARTLGCTLSLGLQRVRHSAPQATLSGQARQSNLTGAFRADQRLMGLRVGLVDDVLTTGATLEAAAEALHQVGVTSVEAWVVAQAMPPLL